MGKMKIPHAQKRETGTLATHSGKCLPTHQKLVCKEMKMSVHIGCKYYFAFLDKKNGSKETTLLSAPAPKDNGCPDGRKQSQERAQRPARPRMGHKANWRLIAILAGKILKHMETECNPLKGSKQIHKQVEADKTIDRPCYIPRRPDQD